MLSVAGLRKHDVAFLLTVRPQVPIGYQYKYSDDFVSQVGLVYVRGCEIEGLLDDQGKLIEEGQYLCVCVCVCVCCLLYTSPSPRDMYKSRMPSSA